MTILLDLTEEQIDLVLSGLSHVSNAALDRGDDHTTESADAAIVAVSEARKMSTTIPVKEILSRAYGSFVEVWNMEYQRMQRLHAEGRPAPIAEEKERKLWKKVKELENIICKMEEKENV